jgi:hypothetical protein
MNTFNPKKLNHVVVKISIRLISKIGLQLSKTRGGGSGGSGGGGFWVIMG